MTAYLRDYQRKAVDATMEALEASKSTLIVLPTGCGKTVCFAALCDLFAEREQKKSLVIAHRIELVEQARDKIQRFTDLRVGFVGGGRREDVHVADVMVASKDSLTSKRLESLIDPDEYGLIVIDEAHHASMKNKTYSRVLDYLPNAKRVGVTATPDRSDKKAILGGAFETLSFNYPIFDIDGGPCAIADGWLTPVNQEHIIVDAIDFSKLKLAGGDWTDESIDAVMAAEDVCHKVVVPLLDRCREMGDASAIVFCSTVKHAEMMSAILNRHREGVSEVIVGTTDAERRAEIMNRYRSGETHVLCGCDVFTEGFDCDRVRVVAIARPTRSRSRFAQMVGRALRPLFGCVDGLASADERRASIAASGKPGALVLGFCGKLTDLKLTITMEDLVLGAGDEKCSTRQAVVDRARDLSGRLDSFEAVIAAREQVEAEREYLNDQLQRTLKFFKPKVDYSIENIDPFADYSHSVDRAGDMSSHGGVSPKQAKLLIAFGVPPSKVAAYSKRQAGYVIDSYKTRDVTPDWRRVNRLGKDWQWLVGA